MKKTITMSVVAVLSLLSATAQDDMYFVPTKKNVEKSAVDYGMPEKTYYSGSHRSVDDYNRWSVAHGSSVQSIDSVGNDIVDFDAVSGVYPDSVEATDYKYTRRMSRFDDYDWWDGYYAGRSDSYWYDPWYSPYWYGSWYGWGYPYYGYYSSWYWNDPWYWGGWYGYHHPVYIGGGSPNHGYYAGARRNGRSWHSVARGGVSTSSARFGGTRSYGNSRSSFGSRSNGTSSSSRSSNSRGTFGSYRSNSGSTYSAPRSSGSSIGSSRSSGSFSSGSRGGGLFGGGGGSRGGGFGGRR